VQSRLHFFIDAIAHQLRRMPTTMEGDLHILERLEHSGSDKWADLEATLAHSDRIAAVRYRLAFKEDLSRANKTAHQALILHTTEPEGRAAS
jgi:hypothetical protein